MNNNNLIAMPKKFRDKFHNACTDACDMLVGPCACGAWHHVRDWPEKDIQHMIEVACAEDKWAMDNVFQDRENYKPLKTKGANTRPEVEPTECEQKCIERPLETILQEIHELGFMCDNGKLRSHRGYIALVARARHLTAKNKALKDYARCRNSCESWKSGPGTECKCTCGLDAILET